MKAKFRSFLKRSLFLLAAILIINRILHDRHDRATQNLPIDFAALRLATNATLWLPQEAVRWYNGFDIDDRYHILKHLKDGGQGSVYLCNDTADDALVVVVVKRITAA